MTLEKLQRAKAYIKRQDIILEYANPEKPFFIFKLNDHGQSVGVTKDPKGWHCDYVETEERYNERVKLNTMNGNKTGKRWGCVFNRDVECVHMLACKLYIHDPTLREIISKNISLKEMFGPNAYNPENVGGKEVPRANANYLSGNSNHEGML